MPANDQDDEGPTDRLVTLSDGVVAIALTLLILSIQVPSSKGLQQNPDSVSALWNALGSTFDGWISYLISFYVIAQFWTIHRKLFRGIRGHRGGLAGWNFVFLLTISVMPFTSALIGRYSENPLSVIIFSCNLILANVAIHSMLTFSRHYGLLNERGETVLASYRSVQGAIDMFFYIIAIPVALYSPDLGKLCWLGLAVSPHIGARLAKHRAAGTA